MSDWEPVIGLEIHVQLATRTKMFCGCQLSFGEEPNTRTCPICLGLPGTLPVVNEQAIHYGVMMGLAFDCEIAPRSLFHRKNYFYPDLPKGYQISQYDIPLCSGGHLEDVRLHRIHLEEDAAKLTHVGDTGRIHGSDQSVVDFNRGGTPLAEIVTEPDIHSAEQARDWLNLLRVTLRQLGVSDVNMEEGSLRCDANVSVRPRGTTELGTKTELKNMNSFRFLLQGVNAEIARQVELLEGGGRVEQETLHFDPSSGRLSSMRSKEQAHDYRYFPEPDLVPLVSSQKLIDEARAAMPELPAARAQRYEQEWGLSLETARLFAFEPEYGDYFESVATVGESSTGLPAGAIPADGGVEELPTEGGQNGDTDRIVAGDKVGTAANATRQEQSRSVAIWVTDLRARIGGSDPAESKVDASALAKLVQRVTAKSVNQTAARQILDQMVKAGGDPDEIIASEGLGAISGGDELNDIIDAAIENNAAAAEKIKAGNPKAIGPIVGYIMRETKGRADGGEVGQLVLEKLGVFQNGNQ